MKRALKEIHETTVTTSVTHKQLCGTFSTFLGRIYTIRSISDSILEPQLIRIKLVDMN